MTQIPEYGTPDADSPEATERDFGFSRRRDGTLARPALYARHRLAELRDVLGTVRTEDRKRLHAVLLGMAEVEEALAAAPPRDRSSPAGHEAAAPEAAE